MANQKLKLLALNNAEQTFGQTDYAVFDVETADNQQIVVGITHNALRSSGINISLLDSLMGSTIVVKDDTDIRTGELVTAEERIGRVVNQEINPNTGRPYQIVLLNRANCSIIKSEIYLAENKDLASSVSAKVVIEKEKERKILSAKRASDRLRSAVAPKVAEEKVEQPAEELDF
jgi:hypothetical protein